MLVLCAGCESPIVDQFLLTVVDRTWHSSCVRCFDCQCPLLDRCFSRDGHQLFCRIDFFRRFGSKCGGCKQGIAPTDLVRRARDCVYHVTCFNCTVCGRQLSTGDEMYILDDSRFICRDDFSLQTPKNTHSVSVSKASFVAGSISPASRAPPAAAASVKQHLEEPPKRRSFDKLRCENADDDDDDDDDDDNDDNDEDLKDEERSFNGDESRDSVTLKAHVISDAILFPSLVSCVNGGRGPASAAAAGGGGGDGGDDFDDVVVNNNHCSNCSLDSNCSDENSNPRFSERASRERDKENAKQRVEVEEEEEGEEADGTATATTTTAQGGATKRRGPRTTIKAKQLDTLKSAFAATPKPTRHIREQLAQETGLNMRVIQVWFQNRRSKERRLKQLSSIGARRQFFRNPRRSLRPTSSVLRPGDEFNANVVTDDHQHPHPMLNHHHHHHLHHATSAAAAAAVAMGYFGESTDFYSSYSGYDELFSLHIPSSSSSVASGDPLVFIPSSSLQATVGEALAVKQVPAQSGVCEKAEMNSHCINWPSGETKGSHLVNVSVDAYSGLQSLMHQRHPSASSHPASNTMLTSSPYLHQQPPQLHQPQPSLEPREHWSN